MKMPLNKIIPIIALSLTSLLLQGCSTPPRKVTASVPLVAASSNPQASQTGIPELYWASLSDPATTTLAINDYQVNVGPIYVSALSQHCRNLDIIDTAHQLSSKRVACETAAQGEWYLGTDITHSSIELNLYKRISL
jgi:hypothetical protein